MGFAVGDAVTLSNMKSQANLNGQTVTIAGPSEKKDGRWDVQSPNLHNGKRFSVRPTTLEPSYRPQVGDTVKVCGLPNMNGVTGIVLGPAAHRNSLQGVDYEGTNKAATQGQWKVQLLLEGGKTSVYNLNPTNFELMPGWQRVMFRMGDAVRVSGRKSDPQLNGNTGTVLGPSPDKPDTRGRWRVKIYESDENYNKMNYKRTVDIKPVNIKLITVNDKVTVRGLEENGHTQPSPLNGQPARLLEKFYIKGKSDKEERWLLELPNLSRRHQFRKLELPPAYFKYPNRRRRMA